jgi:mono/diheme cytochrome c family protein
MFRGQCMACHTTGGYRSIRRLLQGRDQSAIANILQMLHEPPADSPYSAFMPPLVGTQKEIEALADYLDAIVSQAGDS